TPPVNPDLLSTISVIGAMNSHPIGPMNWNPPYLIYFSFRHDTVPLRGGDELLLIVEGYEDYFGVHHGNAHVTLKAYRRHTALLVNGQGPYLNGSVVNLITGNVTFAPHFPTSGTSYTWELYRGNTLLTTSTNNTFSYAINTPGTYLLRLLSDNGHCVTADTLTLSVIDPSHLGSFSSGAIQVYPNPSSGTFTLTNMPQGSYELRITDILGRTVYTERIQGGSKEFRLGLPAGTYILSLSGEKGTSMTPLIIAN
ncbi:MAG: T9SS type A sorting domain-containing protein, partial [Bacteroidia bacterium]|nr:T9SS type A sorting domain-containing protein [Bacteroidia bacterium]MDW8134342.1 T9SS type A sorting domain-containing protein [Bacteroidia bacterium]